MTMVWMVTMFTLAFLHCLSVSFGYPGKSFPEQERTPEASLDVKDTDRLNELQDENERLKELGKYLAYILATPWPKTGLPLLYVEEYDDNSSEDDEDFPEMLQEIDEGNSEEILRPGPFKRSRYYRKYPWKRQNSRQTYEAENRYLCQPSKDDVFRLLVALHEARQGNKGRTINFCNRKRPASAIFTNIRFLGKRK